MRNDELARLAAHPWIQRLEFTQSLASTNDHAAALAAEEFLACPALVWAEEQTAGRGRGGNRWWSSSGGLMFSLILAGPDSTAANWSGYSLTAGLAICEALAAEIPAVDFTVKWPNDVYADGRKICGILIESPAQARSRLIVGIGVNVNNSFASAPGELQATATALCDLDGQLRTLSATLFEILSRLEHFWQRLATEGFAALRDQWQERAFLTGRTVTLQAGHAQHVGRCLGIDAEGSLLLQTERGREAFAAGSIVAFE